MGLLPYAHWGILARNSWQWPLEGISGRLLSTGIRGYVTSSCWGLGKLVFPLVLLKSPFQKWIINRLLLSQQMWRVSWHGEHNQAPQHPRARQWPLFLKPGRAHPMSACPPHTHYPYSSQALITQAYMPSSPHHPLCQAGLPCYTCVLFT